MNINDWSNKELIRFITSRKHLTQKKLAELLAEKTHKDFAQSTIASKLLRNSMKLEEFQTICTLLGFELLIQEKK